MTSSRRSPMNHRVKWVIVGIPVFIFTVSVVVDTAIVVRRRGEGTPPYGIMLHNAIIIEKEELYMEERLQKLLAQAGLCSRREAERWIDDGRVTVNGKKASVGDKADPRRDKIFVDGKPIGGAEEKVYLMLYKPRGYVTTMKDEHGRKTVADLVRGCGARVVPVGRLDYNSEGLLLLTNDGDLLNALTHPRHEVEKHYEVRVRGNLDNIPKLAEPMEIDGYSIRPATVVTIDRDELSAKLRLTIHEGRNRQIRKMCEKCGLEVRRLKRVAMGTMPLDPHLKSGAWRELTDEEIGYLQDIAADVQE